MVFVALGSRGDAQPLAVLAGRCGQGLAKCFVLGYDGLRAKEITQIAPSGQFPVEEGVLGRPGVNSEMRILVKVFGHVTPRPEISQTKMPADT